MSIDLHQMSKSELEKLKGDIDKALVAAEKRNRKEALKAAEKAAAKFGYRLDQLLDPKAEPRKSRAKSPPKYRDPDDPTRTWSGRGRRPKWILDAIEAGTDLADLAI